MAIQWEHCPLLTIEEIATRLHGAKVFTVLDALHGFWHVPLDEASSFLITFNTIQVEENAPLESVLPLRFFSARWMRNGRCSRQFCGCGIWKHAGGGYTRPWSKSGRLIPVLQGEKSQVEWQEEEDQNARRGRSKCKKCHSLVMWQLQRASAYTPAKFKQ